MIANDSKYLLATTFYWLAGIGATVTGGLALAVLAGAQTTSEVQTRVTTFQDRALRREAVLEADHDKLIEISAQVLTNQMAIEKLALDNQRNTAAILKAIKEKTQ